MLETELGEGVDASSTHAYQVKERVKRPLELSNVKS
jgi:hypothetical protein